MFNNNNNNNNNSNNTLIILTPYGALKISAGMTDYDRHDYFNLYNDNM